MSRYTMQLRNAIENNFPIALNEYPIFDESYREVLNKKIIDTYYFYEIEHETYSMFNHELKVLMNNIMPKYNFLYQQQKKLVENVDLSIIETFTSSNKETSKSDLDSNSLSKSSSSNDSINKFAATPQGTIDNIDKYLTQATIDSDKGKSDVTASNNTESNTNRDGESEYVKKITDPFRQFELIDKIKNGFLNIDLEIINELDILFFKLM